MPQQKRPNGTSATLPNGEGPLGNRWSRPLALPLPSPHAHLILVLLARFLTTRRPARFALTTSSGPHTSHLTLTSPSPSIPFVVGRRQSSVSHYRSPRTSHLAPRTSHLTPSITLPDLTLPCLALRTRTHLRPAWTWTLTGTWTSLPAPNLPGPALLHLHLHLHLLTGATALAPTTPTPTPTPTPAPCTHLHLHPLRLLPRPPTTYLPCRCSASTLFTFTVPCSSHSLTYLPDRSVPTAYHHRAVPYLAFTSFLYCCPNSPPNKITSPSAILRSILSHEVLAVRLARALIGNVTRFHHRLSLKSH